MVLWVQIILDSECHTDAWRTSVCVCFNKFHLSEKHPLHSFQTLLLPRFEDITTSGPLSFLTWNPLSLENFSENSTRPTNLASLGGRAHFEKKSQRGHLGSGLEKRFWLMKFTIFNLKSILSDNVATLVIFFKQSFAWNTFFYPFASSLYVSLRLKWVSYRQHMIGTCIFYLFYLRPLIRAFTLFTFKVIVDR